MAGSLDSEWSETGVCVCGGGGNGVGIGVSVPAKIFTSQGECSAHGTASCFFSPLTSFECHFGTDHLPAFLPLGAGALEGR